MRKATKTILGIALMLFVTIVLIPESAIVRTHAKEIASGSNATSSWVLDSNGQLTISGTGWPSYTTPYPDYEGSPWHDYSDQIYSVVINEGIKVVPEYAFYGCGKIKSVSLPDSLHGIWEMAFCGCSSLKEITIPEGVIYIGVSAFRGAGIEKITFPDGPMDIDINAFAFCENLTEIELPLCLKYISSGLFWGCENLKKVTIPASVENISLAFIGCESLTDIYYPCTKEDWDAIDISDDYYISNAQIHYGEYRSIARAEISFPELDVTDEGIYWTTYDGQSKQPAVVSLEGTALKKGRDYTTSYSRNRKPGIATVRIFGTGKYRGSISKDFLICFTDVPMTHQFSKPVYEALRQEIAAGYSGDKTGTFGVSDKVTRGQAVMFLWRWAGRPEPKSNKRTFRDVPTTHHFYKAIQWAVEKGITAGYKDGTFRPDQKCTRGQILMFLWRRAGRPEPENNEQTFTDVPASHSYFKAIQWAAEKGKTVGYKDGSFGVDNTCTRGHCVTFLFR